MRGLMGLLIATAVAMIGYTIHGSLFWSIIDFFFAPFAIIKWLIYHEITFDIIKQTFAFLG